MGVQRDEHYVPKCGDRVEVFALVGAPQLNGRYALFGLRRVLWLCAHSEAKRSLLPTLSWDWAIRFAMRQVGCIASLACTYELMR